MEIPGQARSAFNIDVGDVIGILRRGWLIVLATTLVGLGAALAYIMSVPEPYKSSARILIDRSVNRYLQTNKVVDEPTFDDSETGSQLWVISSESIIIPVVRALKLDHDPEFVGALATAGDEKAKVSWGRRIKNLLRLSPENALETNMARERLAVEAFQKRLTVLREDVASVISVTFAAEDPRKAADIANAVADTYLASTLAAKVNSTKLASQMLQDRLTELKLQAGNAERALQEYRLANNLITTGRGPLSTEQLTTLTTHLTSARVAMAEAKAKLETSADDAVSLIATDNEIILRLRQQYIDMAARATDLEGRVGREHGATIKLRKRMEEISEAIRTEQHRISGKQMMEYQLARARHDELAATMTKVLGEEGSNGRAQVAMRELESSAETLRNLYNNILQRVSQMNRAESQPSVGNDARIITRAAPPLQKSSKKSIAVLGGGVMLGLLLGVGAVFLREFPIGVFRTPEQVTRATGLYCALLPTIQPKNRDAKAVNLDEYVLTAPYSRFAETLRNVWALISIAQREDGAKIIGVVSSVAKEGKSTVAANLASLLSVCTKSRVLLIDGDLHRRTLSTRLAPDAKVGLLEAMGDPAHLENYVHKIERTGLHLLPSNLDDRVPNAADLLGSSEMGKLLEAAREHYDLILVEVAPIVSVIDYKMVERFIDRFVFVIEWSKTSQRLVQEALGEASSMNDRVLCALLNRADPAALRSIEGYKGSKFYEYYRE